MTHVSELFAPEGRYVQREVFGLIRQCISNEAANCTESLVEFWVLVFAISCEDDVLFGLFSIAVVVDAFGAHFVFLSKSPRVVLVVMLVLVCVQLAMGICSFGWHHVPLQSQRETEQYVVLI